MAGLSNPRKGATMTGHKRPLKQTSEGRRTDQIRSRKLPAPDAPVTTDLGLGKPLSDPGAPTQWTFRILHATRGMTRAGRSTEQGYRNAAEAARTILREYFTQAGVTEPDTRKLYSCEVVRFGFGDCLPTPDSHAMVQGRFV